MARVALTFRISSVQDESKAATVIEVSEPYDVSVRDLGSTQEAAAVFRSGDAVVVGDTRIELTIGSAEPPRYISEPRIALAFTQKLLWEASNELSPKLAAVQAELVDASSAASMANVIVTQLVPAFDAFLDSADRAKAFVDDNIARGKWAPDPVLVPFRAKVEEHRTARDALAALATRARAGDLTVQQVWQLLAAALGPIAND